MTKTFDNRFLTGARQCVEGVFKAQTVALEGMQAAAAAQFAALEQQASDTVGLLADAGKVRDVDSARQWWDAGARLGQDQFERAVALSQQLAGISRQTAESYGSLMPSWAAANDAAAPRQGKKTATH